MSSLNAFQERLTYLVRMTPRAQSVRSIAGPDVSDPDAAYRLADATVRRWVTVRFEHVATHSKEYASAAAALAALHQITDKTTLADAAQVVADARSTAAIDPDQQLSASAATAADEVLRALLDEAWDTLGQRAAVVLYEACGTLSTGPGYLVDEARFVLS